MAIPTYLHMLCAVIAKDPVFQLRHNYFRRVAYKKLLTLQVELVSSRYPAQALLTRYLPYTHPAYPAQLLLRPYSLRLTIIRYYISILVPISRLYDIDFIKFRR